MTSKPLKCKWLLISSLKYKDKYARYSKGNEHFQWSKPSKNLVTFCFVENWMFSLQWGINAYLNSKCRCFMLKNDNCPGYIYFQPYIALKFFKVKLNLCFWSCEFFLQLCRVCLSVFYTLPKVFFVLSLKTYLCSSNIFIHT